jgi:hypothetical protein
MPTLKLKMLTNEVTLLRQRIRKVMRRKLRNMVMGYQGIKLPFGGKGHTTLKIEAFDVDWYICPFVGAPK